MEEFLLLLLLDIMLNIGLDGIGKSFIRDARVALLVLLLLLLLLLLIVGVE